MTIHPFELEVEIGRFLFSEKLAQDPRNRCVLILDVLQDPNDPETSIIASEPAFQTIGESVAFFKQAIEGLRFMHEHHVAHRDISILNVMMDATPMNSEGLWHHDPEAPSRTRDFAARSSHVSRTERPVRYFFIDFGLSRKYSPDDGPLRELLILGGDKTVPEFQDDGYDKPSDPLRTDVYYLSSLIRTTFLDKYYGFNFIHPLISDMVQDDPEDRPTIAEVERRFDEIYRRLSWWTLRARLVKNSESMLLRPIRGMRHIFRTAKFVAKQYSSVPIPSSS